MTDTAALSANFFIHRLRYDVASLTVTLEVGGEPYVELQFDPPRAFRVYSESDAYQYLSTFRGVPILKGSDGDIGVFMSEDAPYVVEYRKYARPAAPESTFSCLIATAQECVEVVCFEKPTIRYL
jgi:hypothetical protein